MTSEALARLFYPEIHRRGYRLRMFPWLWVAETFVVGFLDPLFRDEINLRGIRHWQEHWGLSWPRWYWRSI